MPQTFKTHLKSNLEARASFREEQFFMHSFNRALLEAEWAEEELLESNMFNVEVGTTKGPTRSGKSVTYNTPIQHRSDHPDYDKEAAYRHYGSPTEDKAATAASISNWTSAHGKPPGKLSARRLKVFEHDTNPKTAKGVMGIIRNYGNPDQTPIKDEDRKAEVGKNFDKFSELRNSNRKEYKEKLRTARAKMADAGAPHPLKDTTKGDTITNLPGEGESEKNGHISFGMGGTPDERKHVTSAAGHYTTVNACYGKGNCVKSCLAKGGCGGFESTKGFRATYDQMNSHNEAARSDFDLVMHHQLHKMSETAKAEGKGAIVRPDTTTGNQAFTHAEAINKHFGEDSHKVKSGEGHPVVVNTYGKTYGTDKDPHDMSKNGINITMSDQGVPTSKKAIEAHNNLTNLLRQKGKKSRIAFTVLQSAHPKGEEGQTDEQYVQGAKHKDPQKQADYEKAKSVTTVRRYDLTHSEPKAGESWAYHDPKTKSGRVEHEGKSYYYTDHDVPRAITTTEGTEQPSWMHDDRSGELMRHHRENPNDHGINAIAMATTSTNMAKTEVGKSIFHPIRNIDEKGTLHVMHPASPEAAKAREIIAKP